MIPEEVNQKIHEVEDFLEQLGRQVDHDHVSKTMIFNWLRDKHPECEAIQRFHNLSISTWRGMSTEQKECNFINLVSLAYLCSQID